ncbi:MAG: hypothetical protein QOE97_3289 [Pseudonocardiales bacterium]|nr:hypothetical protein [Pseudonocardiales bacterium]
MVGALAAAAAVLSACTGVPTSSAPEVVSTLGAAAPSQSATITPTADADARTIVAEFLAANASDDPHHVAAHAFLAPEAVQRWSDTTVTVVDSVQVGNFIDGVVNVTGRRIGTVNAAGIFAPDPLGSGGGGGERQPFPFGFTKVKGQYRISSLKNGLIIADTQFQRTYQQRTLYYFDLAEKYLVPDPRYTALTDGPLLANWLVGQLADGPRPELQSAVTSELPADIDPARVTVTAASPAQVNVAGAAALDPAVRNRLAAQLAVTLQPAVVGGLSIVDSGRPVPVPAVGGDTFSASEFDSVLPPSSTQPPALYYIANGGVVDVQHAAIRGAVGSGDYHLTSVALARIGGSADLRVAGTSGSSPGARLLVGTLDSGLRTTTLRGQLSRPSWAPNVDEVWVGDGTRLYRMGAKGPPAVVPINGSTSTVAGRVSAIRFSPEGSRVALVLVNSDGRRLWVGSVIRDQAGGAVRVDNLEPISPQNVAITDVAWNDELKLFTIGTSAGGDTNVYELQVDGSLWTPRGTTNLPEAPDSITVAENEVAWVSAGGTVWAQQAGTWISPGPGTTAGSNPVYVE